MDRPAANARARSTFASSSRTRTITGASTRYTSGADPCFTMVGSARDGNGVDVCHPPPTSNTGFSRAAAAACGLTSFRWHPPTLATATQAIIATMRIAKVSVHLRQRQPHLVLVFALLVRV